MVLVSHTTPGHVPYHKNGQFPLPCVMLLVVRLLGLAVNFFHLGSFQFPAGLWDKVSLCADKHLPVVEKGKLIIFLGSHKPQALTKYCMVLHTVKRTPGFLSSVCFGKYKRFVSLSHWESRPRTAGGQKSSRTGEQIITARGRKWR